MKKINTIAIGAVLLLAGLFAGNWYGSNHGPLITGMQSEASICSLAFRGCQELWCKKFGMELVESGDNWGCYSAKTNKVIWQES